MDIDRDDCDDSADIGDSQVSMMISMIPTSMHRIDDYGPYENEGAEIIGLRDRETANDNDDDMKLGEKMPLTATGYYSLSKLSFEVRNTSWHQKIGIILCPDLDKNFSASIYPWFWSSEQWGFLAGKQRCRQVSMEEEEKEEEKKKKMKKKKKKRNKREM